MPLRLFRKTKQQQEREEQEQPRRQKQQRQEQQKQEQAPAMKFVTDTPATTWTDDEAAAGKAHYSSDESYELSFSKQNPTPGKCYNHLHPAP